MPARGLGARRGDRLRPGATARATTARRPRPRPPRAARLAQRGGRGEHVAERRQRDDEADGPQAPRPAGRAASQRPRTSSGSTSARRPRRRSAPAPGRDRAGPARRWRPRRSSPATRGAPASPSGDAEEEVLAGQHLGQRQPQEPAAASPARRQAVGRERRRRRRRPARARSCRAAAPARAPTTAARHAAAAAGSARRAAARTSAVPCRPASGDASQPHSGHGRDQPGQARQDRDRQRGDARRRRRARGRVGAERLAALRARCRRPAPPAPARRAIAPGRGRLALWRLSRRASLAGRPTRISVAGSTSPPSSSSSRSAAIQLGAQLARCAAGARARCRARRRSRRRAPRGRSRPAAASGGSGWPSRRAVAAAPPLRTGLEPVQPRRASARASRRRRRGRRARPRPARAPCRRACPTTSPVRVSGSPLADVRHAEVGQLGEPRAGGGVGDDHHVLRLHVAVDHAARVGVLQRVAERHADPRDVAVGDRARLHQLGKRSAPNELRDQVDVVLVAAASS